MVEGALAEHVAADELDRHRRPPPARPPAPRDPRRRGRRCLAPAARPAQGRRRGRRRHPRVLPRGRARAVRPDLRAPRPGRPGHGPFPGRPREAHRHRPGHGQDDQRGGRPSLRRVAHLPHRPLPRQGERAEPPGHALRQHLPRAAVEQPLGRPRADHRLGVARRRRARLLLRPLRRAARHGAEPPAPAGLPRRDGAADVRRPRDGARREAQGPPGPAPDDARAGRPRHRRRAVRRGPLRRHPGVVVRRRGRPREQHRDLRRAQDRGAELALGGSAVLPAHRQADVRAGLGDRGGLQGAAAPDVPAQRGPDRAQPAAHPRAARRGHAPSHDRQGARPRRHPAAPRVSST